MMEFAVCRKRCEYISKAIPMYAISRLFWSHKNYFTNPISEITIHVSTNPKLNTFKASIFVLKEVQVHMRRICITQQLCGTKIEPRINRRIVLDNLK